MKLLISIVSPVYRGEKMVSELVRRIQASVSTITEEYEIILVNDASPDNSWAEIEKACAVDKRVKGINLSRNFGQHYAITAGLHYAQGEWVVVMDCDLQDRPEEIPNLYKKAMEGWDIVLGRRIGRKDSFIKKMSGKLFYKIFNYLTDTKIDYSVGSYRIMNKAVVENFNQLKETNRYFGGLIDWLGFNVTTIDLHCDKRKDGNTTYTISKLINLSIDAMLSFSDKPLRLFLKLGLYMFMFATMFIAYKIVMNLFSNQPLMGWSSIIAVILFSTGLIIVVIGIIGLYIGKIFKETKQRPLFIVKTFKNINNNDNDNEKSNTISY